MERENFVSLKQLKKALMEKTGLASPVRITRKEGETVSCYIRGFADQQSNILLISDKPNSVGLKIIEMKDIRTITYSQQVNDVVHVMTLHVKQPGKILFFF